MGLERRCGAQRRGLRGDLRRESAGVRLHTRRVRPEPLGAATALAEVVRRGSGSLMGGFVPRHASCPPLAGHRLVRRLSQP
ncbi:hypothetical protein GCM10009558_109880 [Virgisporangium aurantiacum]